MISIKKIKENNKKVINRDAPIALLLDRNIALISTIYNCIMKGIVYIPINPLMPYYQIHQILLDTKASKILTHKKYRKNFNEEKVIYIDENETVDFREESNKSESAYILYTSGTTGIPKGVEVTREGLFNFIEGISEIIDFSAGKRIACFTTVSFDIFILESIMALYIYFRCYHSNTWRSKC